MKKPKSGLAAYHGKKRVETILAICLLVCLSMDLSHAQEGSVKSLADALRFCATFDNGTEADHAMGDGKIYFTEERSRLQAGSGALPEGVVLAENAGYHGAALHYLHRNSRNVYFQAKNNIDYSTEDWSGTVSIWLRLDPENDLEPGFCDPFQITDVNYDDAALWVDFTDRNPRQFRLGVFGDLLKWNPDRTPWREYPPYFERLVVAEDRPFGPDTWTHVVVTYHHLNGARGGKAGFYVNAKHQGTREIPESFSWDLENAKMLIGLRYVGYIDEFLIFDKPLSGKEVEALYALPNGASDLLKIAQ